MNTIPTRIASARVGEATMSVYRTAEGRVALEPAEGAALELYASVDEVLARIPDELVEAVRANAAGTAAR